MDLTQLVDLKNFKWKTVLALAVVYLAVVMGWSWVWGLLFIMWTIPALYSGQTHLVEEINRDEDPVFYWLIIATWIVLRIFMILFDAIKFIGGSA